MLIADRQCSFFIIVGIRNPEENVLWIFDEVGADDRNLSSVAELVGAIK